ncbi:glycosyltransferase [bacterium]|nr:glycosyltransferase [bacterium]
MNILFLSPIVPYPLVDGDRQRAYHLLRHLARGHRVHLLCFLRSPEERKNLQPLKKVCARVEGVEITRGEIIYNCLKAWPGWQPLNVAAFRSEKMRSKVKQTIDKFGINAVHAYRLRMAPYAVEVKARLRILDYTDSLTRYFQTRVKVKNSWWKQRYLKREIERLGNYEAWVSRQFDTCLISSVRDRKALYQLGAAKNIEVITNGVDTKALTPHVRLVSTPELIFVGNMRYVPNQEGLRKFCEEIWPRIRAEIPHVRLTIVGQKPVARDRAWQYAGVEFAGVVPRLEPFFHQARVAICPLEIATGRQFKVLEYFAAGIPAVVTPKVAENLQVEGEKHLLVGNTPEDFAQQVIRLCRDEGLAERLRQAARELTRKEYDWSVPEARIEKIYQRLSSFVP